MKNLMQLIGFAGSIFITAIILKLLRKDLSDGFKDILTAAIFWCVLAVVFSFVNRIFI